MDGIAVAQRDESRALTGLRGVGALLVMLHHFQQHLALDVDAPMLAGLLRKGYLGVDLFFVLSGFVMAMVYGGWFAAGSADRVPAFATFLVRRIARVWPLHAAIILLVTAEWLWSGAMISDRWVAINLAMMQAWGFSAEINPPAWSISTEMLAYLLFPLLVPALLRWRWGVALGLVGAAAAILIGVQFGPPIGPARRGALDIYFNYSMLPLLRCVAGFSVGMVAWRLGHLPSVRRWAATSWLGPAALAAMIAMMLGWVSDLVIYPLLPVIVLGFHYGRGRVWSAFATGPIYRIGVLSYAIYLVHVELLTHFPFGWASRGVELTTYLALVGGTAVLAHWLIEKPMRHWVRRAGEAVVARTWTRPLLQRR